MCCSSLVWGLPPLAWGLPPLALGLPFHCLGFTPLAGLSLGSTTGVYPPNGLPPTFRGKGANPAIRLIMNLTFFWRAWKLDFWPLLGVYPPGLALADYWSHLLGVYPPWPGVYPPSLALGLPL